MILTSTGLIPDAVPMARCVRCGRKVPYTETAFYVHTAPLGAPLEDQRYCRYGLSGSTCDDAIRAKHGGQIP